MELIEEIGIDPSLPKCSLEFLACGNQRFRNVAAPEVAIATIRAWFGHRHLLVLLTDRHASRR